MDLSKIVDEYEKEWIKEAEEKLEFIITKLEHILKIDFKEITKKKSNSDIYKSMILFLFDRFHDSLYEVLNEVNVNVEDLEKELLLSFLLSITRNRENIIFFESILLHYHIISKCESKEELITIHSKFGIIEFYKLDDVLNDEDVKKFIDENSDIKSSCHESTLFLLPRNPNYIAVTARSTKNLYEKYFHSFIIDGEYVIDLTSNLYMKKEEYYELYKVEELNVVKGNDVIKESEESKPFDSSNTLFPLLRNAIYKCEMKKNRKLS